MPTTTTLALASRSGARLAGVLHLPEGAATLDGRTCVVLCHGMESTKEGTKHRALAAALTTRGFACLRFDFSFVGESEGRFEDLTISGEVEDLAGACEHLWTAGVPAIGLVGSSLGGAVAVLYAATEPRLRALVTIAAVARPLGIVERLPRDVVDRWRNTGVRAWNGGRLNRTFLDDLAQADVLAAARRVRAATLVTHGRDDRVVPVRDAELLYEALPEPKALHVTEACDHRFSRADHLRELLSDIEEWLVAHLPTRGASC